MLAVGGSSGGGGSSGEGRNDGNPNNDKCTDTYTDSDVKMPSWFCAPSQNFQKFNAKCYYNIRGSTSEADKTSQNIFNPRSVKHFYQVTFENPPYYDKASLIVI